MNYWIISTIICAALIIVVLLLDSLTIRRLNRELTAECREKGSYKRMWETSCMEVKSLQEKDAKMVSHHVLIRDEQIEHMERTMKEMEARHQAEMAQCERTIRWLEKVAGQKWEEGKPDSVA